MQITNEAARSEFILGVTPDAPVETNKNGGKQSASPYAFELIPPHAIFCAAQVLKHGAEKYGESFDHRNYTKIDSKSHLNHALQPIYAYLAGDLSDDHLEHALVRLMFAVDMDEREERAKAEQNITVSKATGEVYYVPSTAQDVIPRKETMIVS